MSRIVMIMKWDGITTDQYDEVRQAVNWEGNHPKGGVIHIATHDGNNLRVTDVWESADDLNTFINERLMPGVHQVGVESQPQVEIYPLHALFTPAFEEVTA
jgi:hypothetical protein